MNLLWLLSDMGTDVCFCWMPSHCGVEGNERMDQLAKETLDHVVDPLAHAHYADLKQLVNSYIQQLVQIKWGVGLYMTEISIFWNQCSGTTKEIPALHQIWGGCNHPTSNWSYQGNQGPYLVPRTTDYLPPLWSSADHWPYASGVCNVTGKSWHSSLTGYSLRDSSRDLHSGVPTRSGILFDLNDQTCNIIPNVYHPRIDAVCFNFYYPQTWTGLINLYREWKQFWETFTRVGRLYVLKDVCRH